MHVVALSFSCLFDQAVGTLPPLDMSSVHRPTAVRDVRVHRGALLEEAFSVAEKAFGGAGRSGAAGGGDRA
jgi:hypothetical protein